jgi:hypothetical protein
MFEEFGIMPFIAIAVDLALKIWCLVDIYKNTNLSTFGKILQVLLVIFLNLFGAFLYFIFFSRSAFARKEAEEAARAKAQEEAAREGSYAKKYESLEEFCNYLNTHESWEWRSDLQSTINWNDWEDRTSHPNEICAKGDHYLVYSTYEGKYVIEYRG